MRGSLEDGALIRRSLVVRGPGGPGGGLFLRLGRARIERLTGGKLFDFQREGWLSFSELEPELILEWEVRP